MIFSGRTQMLSQYDYPEAIKKIKQLGFKGAEISVLDKDFNIRNDFFKNSIINKIKQEITDLDAVAISCHLDYINKKENIETIFRTFPVARKLGTDIVIINGAVSKAETKIEKRKEWNKMVENTIKLCEQAQKEGIRLAKEFEPGFIVSKSSQLLQLFQEIEPLKLYVNLDLGHVFLRDADPLISIEKFGNRIIHGHIENMKKDIHDHLVPYKGDMDLKKYINKLKEIGFEGLMALDLYNYDYEKAALKSLDYLKSLS